MGALDAAGFLISLLSMSVSVSLLLGGLALCKERLLTRYRARTLYLLGILLTALLLCPWRPSLLLPRITLPAVQVVEAAALNEDTSLPSAQNAQALAKTDDKTISSMTGDVSPEAVVDKTAGDEQQTGMAPAVGLSAQQKPGIPWSWVLFAVWLAGALAVLLFQMIRHARFLLLIRHWQSPVPKDVQAGLEGQCAYLRIKPLRAYTVPCVQSPTVVGLFHPMLLLPEIKYDPQQLSLMLTHELIHYKHRHLWGKALCLLVSAVHWFNPLMPLLMREMGLLCEMACDEAVLGLQEPEQRNTYVDAIFSAVLLTKKVRTPLCSPFDGGVKQMNRIKQRIALMTPFLKRRAGAGLIVCTLLLTLLTGSVLAGEVPASTLKPAPVFSISENDWLTASSDYMPQASYDLLMSMQSPGWEELSTEEYAKQITPQLPRLKEIMNGRPPENRFMRYLQYSMAEAGNSIGKNYKVSWNTGFWWDNLPGSVMFSCELNWKYFENVKLTCAQRNQLLDEALLCADRAVRALNTEEIQKAFSSTDARKEFGARLNENAKDLGGNALSIWFSNVDITARVTQDSQVKKERRELLSPLTPEGYRDQTVQDYQALLKKYQDRTNIREAIESYDNKIIAEAFWELNGTPTYMNGCGVDLSLMPAWTMRGRISYMYRLDWKTVDPGHITVGERHDAIYKLITHIGDAAADAVWEAKDWEAFDKVLKERLPKMAQEESTSALTFTVSEVRLDLDPLATEEYMHSSPQSVLNAFMSACYYKNTAQMAAVCVPVGTDAKYADKLAAREKKLNYYVEMHPGYWELGEARNESGKDDVVIIKLSFYKFYPDETSMHGLESRQAQVKQIDGKWYLVPESL